MAAVKKLMSSPTSRGRRATRRAARLLSSMDPSAAAAAPGEVRRAPDAAADEAGGLDAPAGTENSGTAAAPTADADLLNGVRHAGALSAGGVSPDAWKLRGEETLSDAHEVPLAFLRNKDLTAMKISEIFAEHANYSVFKNVRHSGLPLMTTQRAFQVVSDPTWRQTRVTRLSSRRGAPTSRLL